MAWFVNYQKTDLVSVADRGFSYGDGVFETLLVENATIISSPTHRQRLIRACRRLLIPFSLDDLDKAFEFIGNNVNPVGRHCVKLILTRGMGGRGYLPPSEPIVTLVIGFLTAPEYQIQAHDGVSITTSTVNASINSRLAGLKHLNRLENVLAKQELSNLNLNSGQDYFESLLLDDNGFLVECVQSNIFWYKNNILYTPLLNRSGVQGSLRSKVLKLCPDNVNVGRYCLADLFAADEVFICNSLMSVVPVTFLHAKQSQRAFAVGKKTTHLQCLINQ